MNNKNVLLKILAVIITVFTIITLASCEAGVSPTKSYVDSNNHIIVEFSDGSTTDLGEVSVGNVETSSASVKEIKGISVDSEMHAIVEYSDGTTSDLGYVGVTDSSKNVSVKSVSVNSDTHAIVEFTDGSTQDLGYVGVEVIKEVIKEVEPPLYTVKFVDINGNVLSTQEVYRGKAAKSPGAPAVADATFTGWDYDYTNIQGDVTIKPQYSAAAQYTVTFLSADGATLKTESVISGHAATAPNAPAVSGKIFAGWDKTFNNITSDLTVQATYRNPNNYTVTFKDYTGLVLGSANVVEGNNATAPVTPSREGYKFTGWSPAITNVKGNITAVAQYSFNGGTNIIDFASSVSGNKLTLTVTLKGSVKIGGMQGNITVPAGLTCTGITSGTGDMTVNLDNGIIYYMFSSSSGYDVTSATKLFVATFTIGNITNAAFNMTVEDFYDCGFVKQSYKIIGTNVKVK